MPFIRSKVVPITVSRQMLSAATVPYTRIPHAQVSWIGDDLELALEY